MAGYAFDDGSGHHRGRRVRQRDQRHAHQRRRPGRRASTAARQLRRRRRLRRPRQPDRAAAHRQHDRQRLDQLVGVPADDAAIVSKRGSNRLPARHDDRHRPRTIGFKLTNSTGADMFRYGATAAADEHLVPHRRRLQRDHPDARRLPQRPARRRRARRHRHRVPAELDPARLHRATSRAAASTSTAASTTSASTTAR